MKAKIFDKLDDLNDYLKHRKAEDVSVIFKSYVVGQTVSMDGKTKTYEIVDRWLVLEK